MSHKQLCPEHPRKVSEGGREAEVGKVRACEMGFLVQLRKQRALHAFSVALRASGNTRWASKGATGSKPVSSGFELRSGQHRCMGPVLGGRLLASHGRDKAPCSRHACRWLRQRRALWLPWPPGHRGGSGSRGGGEQLGQSERCPSAEASLSSTQQERDQMLVSVPSCASSSCLQPCSPPTVLSTHSPSRGL